MPPTETTVLVVDDDAVTRHMIGRALDEAGLAHEAVDSGREALARVESGIPGAILLDLVMPDTDGFEVLAQLRSTAGLESVPVVVLTALDGDDDIERIFAAGADDYVRKPFRAPELVARIRAQLRLRDYTARLAKRERDSEAVLELTQTLSSSLDIRNILFTVVQRVAEVAHVDRCSIVLAGEARDVGFVLATSDDQKLRDLQLDLRKYPEIREVLTRGDSLVIRDAASHPLMAAVRQNEHGLMFSSLALVPIEYDEKRMGVIFLRSKRAVAFDERQLGLVRTVANATAIALRNARLLQSLREETRESTYARVEAERRVQMFQRYADFFESAADGMVVIDREGHVLFSNPRAREIVGYPEPELVGRHLEELAVGEERDRVRRLLAGFGEGIYPRSVDLCVHTRDEVPIVLSVNFSSVLHEDDAVLFTFRDVTLERQTEVELKQTKEFLERVIDSSIDAIVSADMEGRILVFNRAASRIFGHRAEEVLGKSVVERLYPPGAAREVMRKIRDPAVSGPGRLEDYRVDMLSATGETIPVKLSAALITENGVSVGSVGVFTDIRDQLRMEARLNRAQEELRNREKQAIVAELAGTAAHELNQPLTSVIGYAELLRRKLEPGSQMQNAADVIIHEAERMAEIVRKIGKITKYETKSYVGETRILDLEKSTEPSSSEPPR